MKLTDRQRILIDFCVDVVIFVAFCWEIVENLLLVLDNAATAKTWIALVVFSVLVVIVLAMAVEEYRKLKKK